MATKQTSPVTPNRRQFQSMFERGVDMTTGTAQSESNFLGTHVSGPVDDSLASPSHTSLLSPSDTPLQTLLPRSVWPLSGGDTCSSE